MMKKIYIGDGVYVELTEQGIVLTTENGIEETNRIVLEPEVCQGLTRYMERNLDGGIASDERQTVDDQHQA